MERLPRTEVAALVADKIVQAMRTVRLREPEVQHHHVTTSIGLAFYQGDATTIEALVKQADTLHYKAKRAGRNTVQMALRLIEGGRT